MALLSAGLNLQGNTKMGLYLRSPVTAPHSLPLPWVRLDPPAVDGRKRAKKKSFSWLVFLPFVPWFLSFFISPSLSIFFLVSSFFSLFLSLLHSLLTLFLPSFSSLFVHVYVSTNKVPNSAAQPLPDVHSLLGPSHWMSGSALPQAFRIGIRNCTLRRRKCFEITCYTCSKWGRNLFQ